ncbi:FG-GAP repeat domain-containing protein [Phycicoccus avicenniae]|uniref:FG-GAP repeat domain-containing protein n=1 Tax=Phycicoccus avicenniae TaxID=2828860 RepID=UPI003D2AA1FB
MRARRVVVGMVAAAVGVLGLLPANAVAAEVDTAPPVLRSVAFSAARAQPGQQLLASVDATDDGAVASVSLALYEATSGQSGTWRSTTPTQPITLAVGTNWADGDWRVQRVVLFDAAGNRAVYSFDGRLDTTPATTSTHGVDLRGPVFTVSGATDWSPPVLEALTPGAVAPGQPRAAGLAWRIDTRGRVISSLSSTWISAEDPAHPFSSSVTNPTASGSATVTLPRGGRWHLRSLELVWSGRQTAYLDSGEFQPDQGAPPLHHDLDFAALDQVVAPDAPLVSVVPRATKVSTYVDTVPGRAEGVTGYRVTVQPADVVRVVPVAQAGADGRLAVDVADLPNGVEQTVSVTSLSGYGTSAVATRRARPVLASTVAAIPSFMWSSDLVATRPLGTTTDTSVFSYESTGSGGLRGPFLMRENSEFNSLCQSLVAFSLGKDTPGTPLCQRDDLAPVAYYGTPPIIGARGWSVMRFVDGGFDLTGDRRADIIAVDPGGQLRLYAQSTTGSLVARPRIGTGWQSMISVVSVGDLTGDRKNDIAAVDASGRLWLYPGNGTGGVTARRQIGSGWHRMGALLALRDFDHDGRVDLGGITSTGDLMLYRGTGTGGVRPGVRIGTGWQRYL